MSNVGDIDDMVNNSLKILSNHKVNNKFKENARKQAEKYNIHKIVPFYESIYIAAMNKVDKQ
jgi:glycosyltransferase involved in cell wall biosynthesis